MPDPSSGIALGWILPKKAGEMGIGRMLGFA